MSFIKNNIKNIIIIVLLILFVASAVIIYKLTSREEDKISEITGTVIVVDPTYVILETDTEDYLIKNIKGTYRIGDEVKFKYYEKDLDNNESPITIKINDEELIKVDVPEQNDYLNDNLDEDNKNNSNTNNSIQNNLNNSNNQSNNINNNYVNDELVNDENTTVDAQVLSYFNELKSDMDTTTIKDSIKTGFITVVDFLFYNGTIKGHTFSELSSSAKLKVLSMALYFDNKIEEYFPGYKETISNTTSKIYTNVKDKIVTAYLNLTSSICLENSELCENAKDGFNDLKINFGISWDLIKDIAGDGLTNLKNWYEIWSGK